MIEQFDPPFRPYGVASPYFTTRGDAFLFWIDPTDIVPWDRPEEYRIVRVRGWMLEVEDHGSRRSTRQFRFSHGLFDKDPRQRVWRPVWTISLRPVISGRLNVDWSVRRIERKGQMNEHVIFEHMLPRLAALTAWSWSRIGPQQLEDIARDRARAARTGVWPNR